MRSPRRIVASERDVVLWDIQDPDGEWGTYLLEDPRRTPETWHFAGRAEAMQIFEERVINAAAEPPVR